MHATDVGNSWSYLSRLAKVGRAGLCYLPQDALGSTRLVATASVTITFSSSYVPYGNNCAVSGKEVFMYTGKPSDSVTGLYYFGARYYDSSIGRFVTQDSYAGDRNDPVTLNLYIYARDNPERYNDPSGHTINGRSFTDFDDVAFMDTLIAGLTPSGAVGYLAPTQTSTVSVTTSAGTVTLTTSTTNFVAPDNSQLLGYRLDLHRAVHRGTAFDKHALPRW